MKTTTPHQDISEDINKEMEKVIEETKGALGITEKAPGAWHGLCYAIHAKVIKDKFKGDNTQVRAIALETKIEIYKHFLTE